MDPRRSPAPQLPLRRRPGARAGVRGCWRAPLFRWRGVRGAVAAFGLVDTVALVGSPLGVVQRHDRAGRAVQQPVGDRALVGDVRAGRELFAPAAQHVAAGEGRGVHRQAPLAHQTLGDGLQLVERGWLPAAAPLHGGEPLWGQGEGVGAALPVDAQVFGADAGGLGRPRLQGRRLRRSAGGLAALVQQGEDRGATLGELPDRLLRDAGGLGQPRPVEKRRSAAER